MKGYSSLKAWYIKWLTYERNNEICFLIVSPKHCKFPQIVRSLLYINWENSYIKLALSYKRDVAIITYFWRWFTVVNATSDNIVNKKLLIYHQNLLNNDVVIDVFFNIVSAWLCLLGFKVFQRGFNCTWPGDL